MYTKFADDDPTVLIKLHSSTAKHRYGQNGKTTMGKVTITSCQKTTDDLT